MWSDLIVVGGVAGDLVSLVLPGLLKLAVPVRNLTSIVSAHNRISSSIGDCLYISILELDVAVLSKPRD